MMERMVGLERLSILQCQELAKDVGFDNATFDLCGPKGKLSCKWLDAYFGIFRIGDGEGFVMASQFQYLPDVWCENLMPEPKKEVTP